MNKMFEKIKIVAFDVDGTILPYGQHEIHKKIKKMLVDLRKKNYIVAIATGREYVTISNVLDDLSADYFIGANGAFIYDLNKKKEIYNDFIHINDVKEIIELTKPLVKSIYVTDSQNIHITHGDYENNWFLSKYMDKIKLLDYNNIDKNQISKIALSHSEEGTYEKIKAALDESGLPLAITATWSRGTFLAKENVDKSTALSVLAKKLDYTMENVMAFGDGTNDYKMIRDAGIGVSVLGKNYQDNLNNKVAKFIVAAPEDFGPLEFLRENKMI
ncbi:putative phosphotransferase [Mycoplasmopsis californica]|uniref:Cof-type HAD-IIB family hydrolase n=1 Tax=Mycoplasmopsis equigenitalium TaxID=114883 RepID=A0ABY5J2E2_9BACT|nr:HAD family hydrolase [Mycoplasmopsis equigenitalium]UUD36894.1 Cof-type HAD-IIB family hydrolase [Mycoplasmopsis equigenitalium]VEU69811.1 putative phosphotransferase [Mycoplasmopsis californica]